MFSSISCDHEGIGAFKFFRATKLNTFIQGTDTSLTATKNLIFEGRGRPCEWTTSEITNIEIAISRHISSSFAMPYEFVSAKILSDCLGNNTVRVAFRATDPHQDRRNLVTFEESITAAINSDLNGFSQNLYSGNEDEVSITKDPSATPSIASTSLFHFSEGNCQMSPTMMTSIETALVDYFSHSNLPSLSSFVLESVTVKNECLSSIPSSEPSKIPTSIPTIRPTNMPELFITDQPSSIKERSNVPSLSPTGNFIIVYMHFHTSADICSLRPEQIQNLEDSLVEHLQQNDAMNSLEPFWIEEVTVVNDCESDTSQYVVEVKVISIHIPQLTSASPSLSQMNSSEPSSMPSAEPSNAPSAMPSSSPSEQPSIVPSSLPSAIPTISFAPTRVSGYLYGNLKDALDGAVLEFGDQFSSLLFVASPTAIPTFMPSNLPSSEPSLSPSVRPTSHPSTNPTSLPSRNPTALPTLAPSFVPSVNPTLSMIPSLKPSDVPTSRPSSEPTSYPSANPTTKPSFYPSKEPSVQPTSFPSISHSSEPSSVPTTYPSFQPSFAPSNMPSTSPSSQPSTSPSVHPSSVPSFAPSEDIVVVYIHFDFGTDICSLHPEQVQNLEASLVEHLQQNDALSDLEAFWIEEVTVVNDCDSGTAQYVVEAKVISKHILQLPSASPSVSLMPSGTPSSAPSIVPTSQPSSDPTSMPTSQPSIVPSSTPSSIPTAYPSSIPSDEPSSMPSSPPRTTQQIFINTGDLDVCSLPANVVANIEASAKEFFSDSLGDVTNPPYFVVESVTISNECSSGTPEYVFVYEVTAAGPYPLGTGQRLLRGGGLKTKLKNVIRDNKIEFMGGLYQNYDKLGVINEKDLDLLAEYENLNT